VSNKSIKMVSEAFSAEYVRELSKARSLENASFWYCNQCGGRLVVWDCVGIMRCRNFAHRPANMRQLQMNVDLEVPHG